MRCEPSQLEDCINCPGDCGSCPLNNCGSSLTCVFGCFDFGGGGPPAFSLSCLAGCVAQTCPDSRAYLDEVVTCTISNIGMCSDPSCFMTACRAPIARCLSDRTRC
jgi:hypothetical protein